MNLDIFEADNNPWILSAKDIKFENNILECFLKGNDGGFKYNRIEIHPLLLNKHLINDNGGFQYQLTSEENYTIMNQLFPKYEGPVIESLIIDECQMLSVDIPKYNDAREVTLDILKKYKLPPISIYLGEKKGNYHMSKFSNLMINPNQRCEITVSMLEIFDNFVNKYKSGWLLYFEDDVRPVNIPIGTDLGTLYNIPIDAEFIRPFTGENTLCDIKNLSYNLTHSGAFTHAFYISVSGCKKVINYAKQYGWKYIVDIDIYKLGKGCGGFPTGYDGWNLYTVNNVNSITPKLLENEKIIMYSMSHVIFNQTTAPCTPFNTENT